VYFQNECELWENLNSSHTSYNPVRYTAFLGFSFEPNSWNFSLLFINTVNCSTG